MDIMYYFRTTNKGIYLMKDLPATSSLSRSFFGYSLGLEVMFMIVFVGVFGLSIYRSVKKIKNPKFSLEKQSSEDQEQQNNENENENQNDTNAKQTNDNLIYRFDEEDHEKEKKPDNDDDAKNEEAPEEEAESVDDYDKEHDENEQRFLEIDNQLTFLMPFLVGHVVCNNIFATNIISLVLMAATVVLYMIFNVKGACAQNKWLSLLFMLPALSSFIPVFINDHSMSTD